MLTGKVLVCFGWFWPEEGRSPRISCDADDRTATNKTGVKGGVGFFS